MKKTAFMATLLAFALFTSCNAQELKTIKLLAPTARRGGDLMEAFASRASIREYDTKELSLQDLSDLLWAANGLNRVEEKRFTAPTAQNKQEICLYLLDAEGAYRYDAFRNELVPVAKGDFRKVAASRQEFSATAPVTLVIVGDFSAFPPERNWTMTDAGYVSQNIYLFCAGNGMATVARGTMDKEGLHKALGLTAGQQPVLNHPVGYRK